MTHQLQYPVGTFSPPKEFNAGELSSWISEIGAFPQLLFDEVNSLRQEQWDQPYRPEGWTVRQVVHHCADSHMNSFIRFKLALTEENPAIKPYHEDRWATMDDYLDIPLTPSLQIIEGLHLRWTAMLKAMYEPDFMKTFFHPEKQKSITLYEATAMYAWHCRHHLGHVKLVSRG